MITQKDAAWLHWQLAKRGGLMWHETCSSCENWDHVEGDADPWGECLEPMAPYQQTHADDACSLHQEGGQS